MASVLIVEDEADVGAMMQEAFLEAGFDVTWLREGAKVLQTIHEAPPDVVLLDILLPYGNGLDILQEIRKTHTTSSLPVVVLTNVAERVAYEKAIHYGATDFVLKIERTPEEMVTLVKHILEEEAEMAGDLKQSE